MTRDEETTTTTQEQKSRVPSLVLQHPLEGLLRWEELHPRGYRVAFLSDDASRETESLTAADLSYRAALVSRALSSPPGGGGGAASARKGDRCLLVFPPGLSFLPALLGCMDAGVIAVAP